MASKFTDSDKLLLSRSDVTYSFTYEDLLEGLEDDLNITSGGGNLETVTDAGNTTTHGIKVITDDGSFSDCVTLSNDTSAPSVFVHQIQAGETQKGDDDNTVVTLGYLNEQLENLDLDDVLIYQGTIDFSKTAVGDLGPIENGYVWAHMSTDAGGDYDPSIGPVAPDPSWNLGFDTSTNSSTVDPSPITLTTVADGELIGLGNSFFGKLGSSSVDIGYEISAEVDETVGGTVLEVDVTGAGDSFVKGIKYTAFGLDSDIDFIPLQVGSSGELVDGQINVLSSTGSFTNGQKVSVDPIQNPGTPFSATFTNTQVANRPSGVFQICQLQTDDDVDSEFSAQGASVNIVTPDPSDPTGFSIEIIDQGLGGYDGSKKTYLELLDLNGKLIISDENRIDLVVKDSGTAGEISVQDLADGADTDKAVIKLTDQDGKESEVVIKPGRGIRLINTGTANEFEIQSTIDVSDEDEEAPTTSSAVFVSASAPQLGDYPITNGSLWYNTTNGRLYVAVTYYAGSDIYFDWIDASPSSFNDAIRKNQNDATDNTLDVNNTFYAQHFDLDRLDPMPPVTP